MNKKHILYIVFTLIIAVLAFALGHITAHIHIKKVPEADLNSSYTISEAPEEDLTGALESSSSEQPSETIEVPEDAVYITCRIVTLEDDWALLAETGEGSIYHNNLSEIPITYEDPNVTELQPGMEIEIAFSGVIAESYPGILGQIYQITVPKDCMNTLCLQYLNALEDLWEEDPALNDEIVNIGIDLSQTSLSTTEKWAVAWAFAGEHDMMPIEGTYEELVDQGYIDGENLYWEDGCLFTICETGTEKDQITFDAKKWRSGLGAIFFVDCKTIRSADGIWTDYEPGGYAIS